MYSLYPLFYHTFSALFIAKAPCLSAHFLLLGRQEKKNMKLFESLPGTPAARRWPRRRRTIGGWRTAAGNCAGLLRLRLLFLVVFPPEKKGSLFHQNQTCRSFYRRSTNVIFLSDPLVVHAFFIYWRTLVWTTKNSPGPLILTPIFGFRPSIHSYFFADLLLIRN